MTDAEQGLINKLKYTAPLFNGASEGDLKEIISNLSNASYHYADDSAGEWGLARQEVAKAANAANALGMGVSALTHLHSHKPQLVPLNDFIDAVLNTARAKA